MTLSMKLVLYSPFLFLQFSFHIQLYDFANSTIVLILLCSSSRFTISFFLWRLTLNHIWMFPADPKICSYLFFCHVFILNWIAFFPVHWSFPSLSQYRFEIAIWFPLDCTFTFLVLFWNYPIVPIGLYLHFLSMFWNYSIVPIGLYLHFLLSIALTLSAHWIVPPCYFVLLVYSCIIYRYFSFVNYIFR